MIPITIRACSSITITLPDGVLCGRRIMILTGIGVTHRTGHRIGIHHTGRAAGIQDPHIIAVGTDTVEAGETGTVLILPTPEQEQVDPCAPGH